MGSAANTAIEESGTNMLYLTFGFLEWYESDDSRQEHLAPLLTLPVALNRNLVKGRGLEVTLERSGDDSASNLSLIEKLRRDFGIDIPTIEDDDTPDSYIGKFAPILEQKKRWRIRRQLTRMKAAALERPSPRALCIYRFLTLGFLITNCSVAMKSILSRNF